MNAERPYLTFIERAGMDKWGAARSLYQCSCGNSKIIREQSVKNGDSTSCGCYHKKRAAEANTHHGLTYHPLYIVWCDMKARCFNPNNPSYKNYGGRGVKMCDEWVNDFKSFYDWCMSNGWEHGLEVDKDMKGNGLLYSPSTCSCLTPYENGNIKRTSRYATYLGKTQTIGEWAKEYGIHPSMLLSRIKRGWEMSVALTSPSKNKKPYYGIRYSFGHIG